jgi:hypothetical protein
LGATGASSRRSGSERSASGSGTASQVATWGSTASRSSWNGRLGVLYLVIIKRPSAANAMVVACKGSLLLRSAI